MNKEEIERLLPELLSTPPKTVWAALGQLGPEIINEIDTMLLSGVSPEFIFDRALAKQIPPEIVAAIIKALHWRKTSLIIGINAIQN